MLRYCNGETGAFDLLYQRHKGPLYRYVQRMIRNPALGDEIYQDVWMRFIDARAKYRESGKFRAWLFQIAHNRIMDHFRKQQPEQELDEEKTVTTLPQAAWQNPEKMVDHQLFADKLLELLSVLPAPQRETFLLRQEAGLSLKEIAELTQTSDEGAKSRLRYAIARLRQGLSEFKP